MAYASTFELFLEFGNDHCSEVFDKMMDMLNADRHFPDYNIRREINSTTKANIIQSILGLGQIFRQQRHPELADLPDIVNFLETELRHFNMRLCPQSPRAASSGLESWNFGQRGH
eukprot:11580327-Heterocapsa_arctica.AAC.1